MNELQELTEFLKLLSAETDRKFRELSAETDRKFQETNREIKELGRYIHEQSRTINGIGDSNGKHTEQLFYTGLLKKPSLNGQVFSSSSRNMNRSSMINGKHITDEFDIVLERPDALAIVEVKYRLRKDDIELLVNRKVASFRTLFPEMAAGKVIYLAAAGLSVDSGALRRAKELGIYVLTQRGEAIELLNDDVKEY